MASDDEDHTATAYLEENLDDESDEDDHTLQPQHDQNDVDLIDDEEDDEEEEEDDSDDVTIADATPTTTTTPVAATPTATIATPFKKPLDDSRRLFQRLWTDEDEIELLQGFLDYTTQRGTNSSHHHQDTAAFYDQIKGKLQLDFNKNQLVEKIRRLKKKYRNALAKITSGKESVFKSPHDQATFDICCKIWSEPAAVTTVADAGIDDEEAQNPNPNGFNLGETNGNGIGEPNSLEKKVVRSRKRSRSTAVKVEENYVSNLNPVTPNVVEETVKSCLLPLFKELVNNAPNGGYGSSMGLGLGIGDVSDEKWRKQNILELEVYLKRLELMQDQVKSKLEELRSMGS